MKKLKKQINDLEFKIINQKKIIDDLYDEIQYQKDLKQQMFEFVGNAVAQKKFKVFKNGKVKFYK